ncbi:hypothetical protein JOF41_001585 [Saccharothrix coeruleofusca]|uniref:putative glycoside hydrolase family 15 protein n=1 Tax=Saccharothrix coeruleofusca TaxID=33919 RepID=UPI001AEB83A0|nr:putative glycoside hydrolase family 15 protein [Saccharothrix coeruleofusca]MBP2335407.1 hypothetical protein [Saccharothrix coeruleofusca]
MPKKSLSRCCAAALLLLGLLSGSAPDAPPAPAAPCAWWYGIGEPPTPAEIGFAARHYDLVVLNATETAAMRRLRALNPEITVLVYKDLASTRDYPGAVHGDRDARYLPTGVGYHAAEDGHPEWFALDGTGRRIEWRSYPRHWQMAVWHPDYRESWTAAVLAEVVREGWDGVLADNDFSTLRHYSDAVLSGTADAEETDRVLRGGLDALVATAGEALRRAGKVLVPNISESRLTPGRWSAHSRHGGGMEESFGLRGDDGAGGVLTFRGDEWKQLRASAALGRSWLLLVTPVEGGRDERVGYASAALLAGPRTCWSGARTPDYRDPDWSPHQGTGLGEAVEAARRLPSGVWTRRYAHGWVAVNPTGTTARVTPPADVAATASVAAIAEAPLDLPAADALILTPPTPPASTTRPTPQGR